VLDRQKMVVAASQEHQLEAKAWHFTTLPSRAAPPSIVPFLLRDASLPRSENVICSSAATRVCRRQSQGIAALRYSVVCTLYHPVRQDLRGMCRESHVQA
jgi:hypothetical protein